MLWIFDVTEQSEGAFRMLLDCFVSLFRQWVLRSAYWKIIAAFAGASLQFIAMSLYWHLPKIVQCSPHATNSVSRGMNGTRLLLIGLFVVIPAMAGLVTFWARRRIAGSSDQIV